MSTLELCLDYLFATSVPLNGSLQFAKPGSRLLGILGTCHTAPSFFVRRINHLLAMHGCQAWKLRHGENALTILGIERVQYVP